jgi:hypothetical protein
MSDEHNRHPDLFATAGISLAADSRPPKPPRQAAADASPSERPARKRKPRVLSPKNLERVMRVVEEVRSTEPHMSGDLGFVSQLLVQTCLPHVDPKDAEAWTRTNRSFTLTINNTSYYDHKLGKHVRHGLPYGTIARLIFAWIGTEAVRTQNPKLDLGRSLNEFLGKLDLTNSGGMKGAYRTVERQLRRLIHSPISWTFTPPENQKWPAKPLDKGVNIFPIEARNLLWDPSQPDLSALWKSEIVLNQFFFEHLLKHHVPVDMRVIRQLANRKSSLGMDIYCWLTARMHTVSEPTRLISWTLLSQQLGSTHKDPREFARDFKRNFQLVRSLYPQANVDFVYGGIRLLPSRTHVLALSPPKSA